MFILPHSSHYIGYGCITSMPGLGMCNMYFYITILVFSFNIVIQYEGWGQLHENFYNYDYTVITHEDYDYN